MRKLVANTFITLDGVMQAPGGPGGAAADRLNGAHKCVASRTLQQVGWGPATLSLDEQTSA